MQCGHRISHKSENVMWRVYEYETGLQLRYRNAFSIADILSLNLHVVEELIFEYGCDIKAVL